MKNVEWAGMRDQLIFNIPLKRVSRRSKRFYVPTGIIWLLVPVIALSALYVAPSVFVWLVYHYTKVVPTVPVLN